MESAASKPRVLVVDVGGTNIKMKATGQEEARKHPSGSHLTPQGLVDTVTEQTSDWEYDVLSIGYPGPVLGGQPACEPRNLGDGWVGFDFEAAFGKPVELVNDAAMQALGSYEGGRMLFLGLGTGLGTAIVSDGRVEPTELAHLPYKKGKTYEEYVGKRGFKRLGKKKWRKAVHDVVERLVHALRVDYVVIGGGQAKKLEDLPPNARLGSNANAFLGGFRLWEEDGDRPASVSAPGVRGDGRNRPTNTLLAQRLTPATLGGLIALYEHKVFVQGTIWGIDACDPWGGELGKILARRILPELWTEAEAELDDDSFTNALIRHYRQRTKRVAR